MWDNICRITEFLWGTPLIILMIGVGLYLTIGTGAFQIVGIGRWWKKTVGEIFGKTKKIYIKACIINIMLINMQK